MVHPTIMEDKQHYYVEVTKYRKEDGQSRECRPAMQTKMHSVAPSPNKGGATQIRAAKIHRGATISRGGCIFCSGLPALNYSNLSFLLMSEKDSYLYSISFASESLFPQNLDFYQRGLRKSFYLRSTTYSTHPPDKMQPVCVVCFQLVWIGDNSSG